MKKVIAFAGIALLGLGLTGCVQEAEPLPAVTVTAEPIEVEVEVPVIPEACTELVELLQYSLIKQTEVSEDWRELAVDVMEGAPPSDSMMMDVKNTAEKQEETSAGLEPFKELQAQCS